MADNYQIEQLAADIGDKVYIDVAKWHLYLKDAKLHTTLAEKAIPVIEEGLTGDKLNGLLNSISIDIGGGKKQLPLADLIPATVQANLMDILQDFARDM